MGRGVIDQQGEEEWRSGRKMGGSTGGQTVNVIVRRTMGGGVDGVRGMRLAMPVLLAARGFFHAMRYFPD